jgi:hypothetical protein
MIRPAVIFFTPFFIALLFAVPRVEAQTTYTLKATPKSVAWGYYGVARQVG